MRLFIGIYLPQEVKEELYNLQKKFDRKNSKINWVAKNKLHLTLKFLGDIDENNVEEITKRLNKIKIDTISDELRDISYFENYGKIDVLYVKLKNNKGITDLQRKIDQELLDLFPKYQKFNPHLTIGRVKMIKKKEKFIDEIKNVKIKPLKLEVDGFSLIVSKPNNGTHKYITLKEFNK